MSAGHFLFLIAYCAGESSRKFSSFFVYFYFTIILVRFSSPSGRTSSGRTHSTEAQSVEQVDSFFPPQKKNIVMFIFSRRSTVPGGGRTGGGDSAFRSGHARDHSASSGPVERKTIPPSHRSTPRKSGEVPLPEPVPALRRWALPALGPFRRNDFVGLESSGEHPKVGILEKAGHKSSAFFDHPESCMQIFSVLFQDGARVLFP